MGMGLLQALIDGGGDVIAGVSRLSLVRMLAWQDLRKRYRRSVLGPFWITISMGVTIATIGVVFGQIFRSPMREFLPFLTLGMILWSYFAAVLTEGCTGFIVAEAIIKQLPVPLFSHILTLIWRNALIAAHNLVIVPLVYLAVGKGVAIGALLCLPGILLASVNLGWMALILAVLCARFRDLPQIVTSVLQIAFYVTPIIWMPHLLPRPIGIYFLDVNPFFHMLETIRGPLLGSGLSLASWIFSLVSAVLGWAVALLLYGRYRHRIAYWL